MIATCKRKLVRKILEPKIKMIMSGRQEQTVNGRKYVVGNNFSNKWRRLGLARTCRW